MNILIPVDPAKRKPDIKAGQSAPAEKSVTVLVKYMAHTRKEVFALAFYDYEKKCWNNFYSRAKTPDINNVIEWYDEVELKSLFPDDDLAYNAAKSAGNETSYKTFLHQEGQTFFKNYLLRSIRTFPQQ